MNEKVKRGENPGEFIIDGKVYLSANELAKRLGRTEHAINFAFKKGKIGNDAVLLYRKRKYFLEGPATRDYINSTDPSYIRRDTVGQRLNGVDVVIESGSIPPDSAGTSEESKLKLLDDPTKTAKGELPDYSTSRKRKEFYEAHLAGLRVKEKMGELVSSAEVRKSAFECARITKQEIMNVPKRISAQLTTMTDQHSIEIFLEEELERAIANIAGELK